MATVPTVKSQSVLPGVTQPMDLPKTNALLQERGRTAEAVYNLGSATKQGFDLLGATMVKQQDEDDRAEAKKLDIELADIYRKAAYGDGTVPGYKQLEGEDAVNGMKAVSESVQKQVDSLRAKASNKTVREYFDMSAAERTSVFNADTSEHLFGQRQKMMDDTSQARMDSAANDAAANYGNDKAVSNSLTVALGEVADLADRHGWSKEVAESKMRTATTNVIGSAILGSMATGSTGRASQLLKQYGAGMDQDKVASIKSQITQMNKAAAAQAEQSLYMQAQDDMMVLKAGGIPEGWEERKAMYKGTKYEKPFVNFEKDRSAIQNFSHMSMAGRNEFLAQFPQGATMTPDEARVLGTLQSIQEQDSKDIAAGKGYEVAARNAVVPPPQPLDSPEAFKQREKDTTIAAKWLGVTAISPFTPAEEKQYGEVMKYGSPQEKAALTHTLTTNLPNHWPALLTSLANSEKPGSAIAVQAAATGTEAGTRLAESAWRGEKALADGQSFEMPSSELQASYGRVVGNAYEGNASAPVAATIDMAKNLYADMVGQTGDLTFKPEVMDEAMRLAAQSPTPVNGHLTPAPRPGMEPWEVEDVFASLSASDAVTNSVHGGAPIIVGSGGEDIPVPVRYKGARWVAQGDGVYRLEISPGKYAMDSVNRNRLYEVDLKNYEGRLARNGHVPLDFTSPTMPDYLDSGSVIAP